MLRACATPAFAPPCAKGLGTAFWLSRQVGNQQHKDGPRVWEKAEKVFPNQHRIAKAQAGREVTSHRPFAGEAWAAPARSHRNSLPKCREASPGSAGRDQAEGCS